MLQLARGECGRAEAGGWAGLGEELTQRGLQPMGSEGNRLRAGPAAGNRKHSRNFETMATRNW